MNMANAEFKRIQVNALGEVDAEEVSVNENWIGCGFPEALKALWSEFGQGLVGTGMVYGPFEVADRVRLPAPVSRFPFYRAKEGVTFAVDPEGQVHLQDDRVVKGVSPIELVRRAALEEGFVAGLATRVSEDEEGLIRRTARRFVSILPASRQETSLGA